MQLLATEITVGVVCSLDEVDLMEHGAHGQCGRGATTARVWKVRPMVCIERSEGWSVWAPLSTTNHPDRLLIRRKWRVAREGDRIHSPQWLLDGAQWWRGPDSAFVAASRLEYGAIGERAAITAEGVSVIRREIRAQAFRSVPIPSISEARR